MNKIEVLDQHTIDKIAAGEVVERPSSVVKELVENAIDAGATAVTVEITDGGKKLIRITDNGSGIPSDQVRTAFLSHATSKIRKVEDLLSIASLGFRGEALSSIAAVSCVELITKTPSSLSGTRYIIEGGVEQKMEEMGAPDGTTFLVRNLFFNTPARSKFLKSDTTEANYISALLEQISLSHPEVSFKYIQNKQMKLHTSGNSNRKDTIYSIYGRDITKSLIEVNFKNDFMEITGYVGKPEIARGNRTFENYYINGRFVKSRVITKAVEDGYKNFLMQHKFPFVSLQIEMDGNDLDVNVHPNKMEVRFAREAEVYGEIRNMVFRALSGKELIPKVSVGPGERKAETPKPPLPEKTTPVFSSRRQPSAFASNTAERPVYYQRRDAQRIEEERKPYTGQKSSSFTPEEENLFAKPNLNKSENITGAATNNTLEGDIDHATAGINHSDDIVSTSDIDKKGTNITDSNSDSTENSTANSSAENQCEETAPASSDSTPELSASSDLMETSSKDTEPAAEGAASENVNAKEEQISLFSDSLLTKEARSRHKLIGQIFDTYWLVQFEDNFYIIDQHAAHEKIYYERFVKEFQEQSIESQYLNPALIVTLNLQEEGLLNSNMQYFRDFGFEIEHFGGKEYAISAVPVNLYRMDETELFLEMLDQLADGHSRNALDIFTMRLATMACKAAVKGNHRMSPQEADSLIDELLSLDNPYNCPHGRPTIIAMSKTELEKKFKRIV